jgi:hypothetical protein
MTREIEMFKPGKREIEIGKLPPGEVVTLGSGKRVFIKRHGEMGTEVKPEARVAKQVTDKKGKVVRFSSEADSFIISSASPVTRG